MKLRSWIMLSASLTLIFPAPSQAKKKKTERLPPMEQVQHALDRACGAVTVTSAEGGTAVPDAHAAAACQAEGQAWIAKYVTAPGHKTPCSKWDVKDAISGILLDACTIPFIPPKPPMPPGSWALQRSECLSTYYVPEHSIETTSLYCTPKPQPPFYLQGDAVKVNTRDVMAGKLDGIISSLSLSSVADCLADSMTVDHQEVDDKIQHALLSKPKHPNPDSVCQNANDPDAGEQSSSSSSKPAAPDTAVPDSSSGNGAAAQ